MQKFVLAIATAGLLAGASNARAQSDFDLKSITKQVQEGAREVLNGIRNSPTVAPTASNDRQTVTTYGRTNRTARYIGEGAAFGLIVGVGGNCIANVVSDKRKCLDNAGVAAAVGVTLGAAGGWYTAAREQKYASQADAAEKRLNAARLELEQARQARAAAQRIVATHAEELAALRVESEKNPKKKADLNAAIKRANEDAVSLRASATRLDGERDAILAQIEVEKRSEDKQEYTRVASELKEEKTKLEAQIARLDAALAPVPA